MGEFENGKTKTTSDLLEVEYRTSDGKLRTMYVTAEQLKKIKEGGTTATFVMDELIKLKGVPGDHDQIKQGIRNYLYNRE